MSEVEPPGIEGKVWAGGVAQSVTREGDLVRIKLTPIPGAELPADWATGTIALPEPVEVEAGAMVQVEIEGTVPSGGVHVARPMTLTHAYHNGAVAPQRTLEVAGPAEFWSQFT